jgi:hypothetical protein
VDLVHLSAELFFPLSQKISLVAFSLLGLEHLLELTEAGVLRHLIHSLPSLVIPCEENLLNLTLVEVLNLLIGQATSLCLNKLLVVPGLRKRLAATLVKLVHYQRFVSFHLLIHGLRVLAEGVTL